MSRANPLFRSPFYAHPSPSPSPSPSPPLKRKVVNIPVHFVSSSIDRSSAATTIQRAFRGFLVRKNMTTVRQIEGEVEAIVRRIESEEGIDLILRDEKERSKVNEMLMRLLFRLDSVRGVRDYRRKVIRRVISLQEAVDAMSPVRSADVSDRQVEGAEPLEGGDLIELHRVEEAETLEDGDSVELHQVGEAETREDTESGDNEDQSSKSNQLKEMPQPEEIKTVISKDEESLEMPHQTFEDELPIPEADESMDEVIKTLTTEDPLPKPGIEGIETLKNENQSGNPSDDQMEVSEEWELVGQEESAMEEEEESSEVPKKGAIKREESKCEGGVKEVMERMEAENEKLKGLVLELCKRSAQQCRLMGGLAERVGQLERLVQKMERKRKKNKSLHPVDKKCGRDDKTFL